MALMPSLPSAFAADKIHITFNVTCECATPKDEVVCVRIGGGIHGGREIYALNKITNKEWSRRIDLDSWSVGANMPYRYCRNYMDSGADESFDDKNKMGLRWLRLKSASLSVNDVVHKWRWWPVDGIVPKIDDSEHFKVPPVYLPQPEFIRGIELPDFWWDNFSRDVEPTLDKIVRSAGADWIQYCPIPQITRFYPTPLIIREAPNGTPEKELIKIIVQAHNRGLKVFLNPFPWPAYGVEDPSPNSHSDGWWRAFEAQWRPIMLYYATIAQRYGVEMLGFLMWPAIWNVSWDEARIVNELSTPVLESVRAVYRRFVCTLFYPWGPDIDVYGKSDYLGFKIWDTWPYKMSESDAPRVADMAETLSAGINDTLRTGALKWGKQVVLNEISSSSFDGTVRGVPNWESQLYYYNDNPKVAVDLQEQADAYEAILRTVSGKSWIIGSFSFNYNYWDSIDKAPSIRAKPAERVVAKWFQWMNPNSLTLTISSLNGGSTVPKGASYVRQIGDSVEITAKPAAGYAFSEWTGTVAGSQKTANPLTMTMGSDVSVVAHFKRKQSKRPGR
jgi:hypothetical protein